MSIPVLTSLSDTGQVPASADAAYPADLLRAVAEAYGLPAPFSTERLNGGFANDVYPSEGRSACRPFVPLLQVKRILEVLRAPTDRHPRWDYQLANLRAYQLLGGEKR
jgi:hypothetical protein